MAQGPIRAPHIRAGRIAVRNRGGRQTTPVALPDQECAAGPVGDTLSANFAVAEKDAVVVTVCLVGNPGIGLCTTAGA